MESGSSIYDYYEKISDRFYVAFCIPSKGSTQVKFIWEPLARKIIISGYTDFDFFLLGKRKYLEVCEGLSGSVILRQQEMESRILRRCNCKLLIDCLPSELNKRGGRASLNQAIVNFIFEHDQKISPRYKVKKI